MSSPFDISRLDLRIFDRISLIPTSLGFEIENLKKVELFELNSRRGGPVLMDYLDRWTVYDSSYIIASNHGALVGFLEFVETEQTVTIVYILTIQEFRRRGVASLLYNQLCDIIKNKYYKYGLAMPRIDSFALPGDLAAKSLFESLGSKGGLIIMTKDLNR